MEELVEHWTVLPDEDTLLFGRHQDTKLAFALIGVEEQRYSR